MPMTQTQIIGLIGSLILFVGVFCPFISFPVVGNVNYFYAGSYGGVFPVVCALLSMWLVWSERCRWLIWTGSGSIAAAALALIYYWMRISDFKAKIATDLVDNPFRGLADAMLVTIQFQWGWAVIIIGAGLLIYAGATASDKEASERRILTIRELWLPALLIIAPIIITVLIKVYPDFSWEATTSMNTSPTPAHSATSEKGADITEKNKEGDTSMNLTVSPVSTVAVDETPRIETGNWDVIQEKDPIDDSDSVFLYLVADKGRGGFGTSIIFHARCRNNKTDVYISWNDYLGSDRIVVLTRIGKNKARKTSWNKSTDSSATFARNPIALLKEMLVSDKFVAQVTPYNKGPVTAIFDTTGLDNAIKPLRKVCGW